MLGLAERLQAAAGFVTGGRFERSGAGLDAPDHAVLIDHEDRALREAKQRVEDSVALADPTLCVAQEREIKSELFRKTFVRSRAADADAEDLSLAAIDLGETSLVRLQLASSGGGVRQDIEDQNDALLPEEIAQSDRLAVLIGQGKVGGSVTHGEGHQATTFRPSKAP